MDLQSWYQLFHHNPALPQSTLDTFLYIIKSIISLIGTLIILLGVISSLYRFLLLKIIPVWAKKIDLNIDFIRRDLGRTIILGLEFIIAADVISTTTTPDYYSLGILAIIVIIRTFLSFTLNREINLLPPAQRSKLQE